MTEQEDLEKRAEESGCTFKHPDRTFRLIVDGDVDLINSSMGMIRKDMLRPFKADDGHKYLGISEKSSNCRHCFPFGTHYFCQNHERIKQYLAKNNPSIEGENVFECP